MTIGERLLKLRKEKNISQEELANALDVSRQTISKWETGESVPDFNKICPLCDYFKITSDELITGNINIVEANKEDRKKKFARNIALSVSLYIISIIMIILFSTTFDSPTLGVCLFFLFIAIGTGLIVYTAIAYGKDEEEKKKSKKENKNLKLVCEIIDIIGLVVYFLVSFSTGAWHITWIIFLIIGLCEAIVKLIYGLKENNKEEIKMESEDDE